MSLPPPLRLTDGDNHPRPGHYWPGTARVKAGVQCRYHLEPGRWYRVVGNMPHRNPKLTQWSLDMEDGDQPLLVEEMYLELGPDDPAAFQQWAEDCREEDERARRIAEGTNPG